MDVPQPAVHNTHKSKWEGEQERAPQLTYRRHHNSARCSYLSLCGDALAARTLTFCPGAMRCARSPPPVWATICAGGSANKERERVGILLCSVMRLIGNGAALPAALFYHNKMQVQLLENAIGWNGASVIVFSFNFTRLGYFQSKTIYKIIINPAIALYLVQNENIDERNNKWVKKKEGF
jgi:hypothetical protein